MDKKSLREIQHKLIKNSTYRREVLFTFLDIFLVGNTSGC